MKIFKDSRNAHLVVLRVTSLRNPFTLSWDHKKDSQRLNPQTATWRIRACAHVCVHTHTSFAHEMLIYVTCYNCPNTGFCRMGISLRWPMRSEKKAITSVFLHGCHLFCPPYLSFCFHRIISDLIYRPLYPLNTHPSHNVQQKSRYSTNNSSWHVCSGPIYP